MSNAVKTPRKGPTLEELLTKAKTLPEAPGCYLMKAREGEILYVGKAKNLKARVVTYFNQSAKSIKTTHLVEKIFDFDIILAGNEAEALILECNLIKKHAPKYNIRLRDDKSYPYVVATLDEPFSTFHYDRRPKRNGKNVVFGPFPNAGDVSAVLKILIKGFGLRDCSVSELKTRKEPCLLYQLKQCSAPCVGKISESEYLAQFNVVLDFFQGNPQRVLEKLQQRMLSFANEESFEQAAFIRDSLPALEKFILSEKQSNAEFQSEYADIDVLAFHRGEIEVDISLYVVRKGILMGNKSFHFAIADCQEDIEMEVVRFVLQYYAEGHDTLPLAISCDLDETLRQLMAAGMAGICRRSVEISSSEELCPQLFLLASEHAREIQRIRIINQHSSIQGLIFLQNLLNLKEVPKRLECFDIALWQGEKPTAGVVVFEDGHPLKKDYRFYHLETRPEGNNDFAFMREALKRRLEKGPLPDVFVVDGGKGQLAQFVLILSELKLEVPVVALAKERTGTNKKGEKIEERIFISNRSNPIPLMKSKALMKILVHMRDEAHRFSRKLHHHAFHKERQGAWLDEISGIGPKAKQKILRKLEIGIQELKKLSVSELQEYFDLNQLQSENLHDRLQKLDVE